MSERDHSHATSHADATPTRDEAEPGRSSKSALMRKPSQAIASGLVQRKARDANGVADGAEHAVSAASSSSGSALPDTLMRKFESSLGADLSGVRVHTGEASAAANDAVGAKAYTLGNDIHFGAGHYDPSSSGGQHLLAHEVAHTVQQSGMTQRMQFKLAVSSPGDHLEHEADRAADAMVSGSSATVTMGSGVQRKVMREAAAGGGEPAVKMSDIEIGVAETTTPKVGMGPFKGKASVSGKVVLKPGAGEAPAKEGEKEKDKEKEGGAKSVEVKTGVEKDKIKVSAEKEFGEKTWGFQPKMFSEAELDKEGKPKLNIGISAEHEGYKFDNVQVGPLTVYGKAFEWEKGAAEPTIGALGTKFAIAATTAKPYVGYRVSANFEGTIEIEPNWEMIGKWIAEQAGAALASSAAGVAGAIAAPFAAAAVMLVGWAKAGHEFDEVQHRIENLRARCKVACGEAMTGKHVPVTVVGVDINASTTELANELRTSIATKLGIPEGAFAAIAKSRPAVASTLYQLAWSRTWPDLKAKLMANYKDTTFTSYKFERMWLDSFDTGDFSKG